MKINIMEIKKQGITEFNYNAISDINTLEFLQKKATEIQNSLENIIDNYTRLGQDFKMAQDILAKNGYGCFGEWFTSLGFKKATVYRLIDRYNLIVSEGDKQDLIENMQLTLVREIVKKNVDEELKEEVLAGKITTTKEFKERVKQKKEAEKVEQLAGQLDITDVIEVTTIEAPETSQQDTQVKAQVITQSATDDIAIIYNLALDKLEEINIRQGGFYNDGYGFLEMSDISSLIITMHMNKEMTLEQMTQIAQKYKLDIPVIFSTTDESLERYYEQLNKISNSYRQYTSDNNYVYDTVESQNYDYTTVVECNYEEDEVTRKEYQDAIQALLIERDGLTLTIAYDAFGTENLVVYNNKKLIANYKFHCPEGDKYSLNDWQELENYITKLFELDGIDSKYIQLIRLLRYKLDRINKAHLKIVLNNNKELAKFTYIEGDYIFLVMPRKYINKGDGVYIYQNLKEIGSCHLSQNAILGEDDFDIDIDHNEDLKELKSKIDKQIWERFRDKLFAENRRIYKAREDKQKQQYSSYSNSGNSYSDYDYSKMFSGSATTSTGSKLIDGIAKLDKVKKKNIYKALSMQLHPDTGGTTELMQFVTELKQEWGV